MMVMEVAQLSQTVNNEQQRMRVMLTHWHHWSQVTCSTVPDA